jgi:four helix bundle protein
MANFAKLRVWNKAHALALNVHRLAATIRGSANSSLRNQMTRSAMSIPANIVEGRGQTSPKEFARFLSYALNSSSELEYHLVVARDLGLIAESHFRSLSDQIVDVRKMLYGLTKRLANPDASTPSPHGSVPTSCSEQR